MGHLPDRQILRPLCMPQQPPNQSFLQVQSAFLHSNPLCELDAASIGKQDLHLATLYARHRDDTCLGRRCCYALQTYMLGPQCEWTPLLMRLFHEPTWLPSIGLEVISINSDGGQSVGQASCGEVSNSTGKVCMSGNCPLIVNDIKNYRGIVNAGES